LLESLPEVINRYPDARVTIAGLWQNAAEKAEAIELVKRGKLETATHFVGEVTGTDKIKLFQQHDLFVFTPLLPEGLPWVILEAMSASLPVITSNQGAISEVVEQGVTGLIIPAKKESLVNAICRLLNNAGEADSMGAAGRARVAEHFSEQVYLERLVGVFSELMCPAEATAQNPAAVSINKPAASHSIEQIGQTGSN
jgi:glycosyltransferase involved in cell wall biosynthesis